ncbi:hypothetical protein FSP39_019275, partial [Pinctada imbricata]
ICICFNYRRERDILTPEDTNWNDAIRTGTIPTTSSLRAPPTHIGVAGRKEKLIGITNQEASKRYMIKLQKDRERNNEAVHRSLDNLPIKIRQMSNDTKPPVVVSPPGQRPHFESRLRGTAYSEQIDWDKLHQSFEAIPVCSSVTEAYMLGKKKPGTRHSKYDPSSKTSTSKSEPKPNSSETYESKTSGYESDTYSDVVSHSDFAFFPSDFPAKNAVGFQGHPIKSKKGRYPRRKNVAFGSSSGRDFIAEDFRRRYQTVMDANRNLHFVHSSLITGKRVKRINKLPPLSRKEAGHDEGGEIMNIRRLESERSKLSTLRLSLYSPPVPVAPHQSFISENTEYQQQIINHIDSESDYVYDSESETETETRRKNAGKRVLHIDIPSVQITDHSTNENEYLDDWTGKSEYSTAQDGSENSSYTPLSYKALQKHDMSVSDTAKEPRTIRGLTDITERGESNLTRTTQSNQSNTEVKMSIRIDFKQKEDTISESSNVSPEVLVPRWSRESKRKRSSIKDESEKVMNKDGTFSEYNDIYKAGMKEISQVVNEASASVSRIEHALPKNRTLSDVQLSNDRIANDDDVTKRTVDSPKQSTRVEKDLPSDNTSNHSLEARSSEQEDLLSQSLVKEQRAETDSGNERLVVEQSEMPHSDRQSSNLSSSKTSSNLQNEDTRHGNVSSGDVDSDEDETEKHGEYWKHAETFFVTGFDDLEEEKTFEEQLDSSSEPLCVDKEVKLNPSNTNTQLEVH